MCKIEEIMNSLCNKCHRKGFVWARGVCQYCGNKQFDDALFLQERILKSEKYQKEIERNKNREEPCFSYMGLLPPSSGDGFGDWISADIDFFGDDNGGD